MDGLVDGSEQQPNGRIPEFSSIQEEAEFWDTHEITDYLDESWPVELTVAPDAHSVYRLTVRLRFEDWETLEQMAARRAVDPRQLAVKWLTERVRHEAQLPAPTGA